MIGKNVNDLLTEYLSAKSGWSFDGRSRFLGLTSQTEGDLANLARWRVEIASDGLDLNAKSGMERDVSTWAQQNQIRVTCYFKKTTQNHNVTSPAPRSGGTRGAFGITFARRQIPGVKRIIAVASGKGGVGKSTVSSNLAVALARSGRRVGLVDADIYGPSSPMMLGVGGPLGITADRMLIPHTAHGIKVVSMGFLADAERPAIWRGPMASKALEQFLFGTAWGELDELIVDLPPGTGDIQLTLIEKLPMAGAVLVTTPQDVAMIDLKKAWAMFEKLGVPIIGAIENMAVYRCTNCGHEDHVFGEGGLDDFARSKRIAILGRLPLDKHIRISGDAGIPVASDVEDRFGLAAPFMELASRVVAVEASRSAALH